MNYDILIFIAWGILGLIAVIDSAMERNILADFPMVFTKAGRAQMKAGRYLLHLKVGGAIGFVLAVSTFWIQFVQFRNAAWYEVLTLLFVASVILVAALWEAPRQILSGKDSNGFYKAPFDWRDVRMSAYGIALVGATVLKVLQLIFNI